MLKLGHELGHEVHAKRSETGTRLVLRRICFKQMGRTAGKSRRPPCSGGPFRTLLPAASGGNDVFLKVAYSAAPRHERVQP